MGSEQNIIYYRGADAQQLRVVFLAVIMVAWLIALLARIITMK